MRFFVSGRRPGFAGSSCRCQMMVTDRRLSLGADSEAGQFPLCTGGRRENNFVEQFTRVGGGASGQRAGTLSPHSGVTPQQLPLRNHIAGARGAVLHHGRVEVGGGLAAK